MQIQLTTPAAILKNLSNITGDSPVLVLVSGARGAGKTTWCLELYQLARANGNQPVGVVSLAVFESGIKKGIDLMNLITGERRRLADLRDLSCSRPNLSEATLNWAFDPEALTWGNQVLQDLPASEILIVDELGPLEFYSHTGLTAGLERIDEKVCPLSCVVVRPELLDAALTRWPWAHVIWVNAPPTEDAQV